MTSARTHAPTHIGDLQVNTPANRINHAVVFRIEQDGAAGKCGHSDLVVVPFVHGIDDEDAVSLVICVHYHHE